MAKSTATRVEPAPRHSPMEHPRHQYPAETAALQVIAESCGLLERIKWGKPCFTLDAKNIVLIQRFNRYIALLFFKGALLHDPENLLFRVGEHMRAPRQMRFTSVAEITNQDSAIRSFIQQAIGLERSGAKVEITKPADLDMPQELLTKLQQDAALHQAFHALTPGRRKSYIYRIASAKQSATRASRVEQYAPQILAGKGMND